MALVLAAIGVIVLTLPHAMPAPRHVHRDSRWTVTGTGLGLRLIEAGAALTAAPTLLRAAGVHSMADACHRLASPIAAGSVAGDITTALAIGLLLRTTWVRMRIRRRRAVARIEPTLGTHRSVAGFPNTDLVVLPTDAWVAYAIPGSPNQVVISDGVNRRLEPAELEALIDHEVAHLRLGHHRALRLLAEIDGIVGGASRRFTDRLRLMLERAADEVAASTSGPVPLRSALSVSAGPNPDPTMVVRRHELGAAHGNPSPVLPAIVMAGAASAVGVVIAMSSAAEHGLWGILGICGL